MPTFRGKPACECLVKWLPVYEAELLRRGEIKFCIDVYQLIGGASASAGTHATGGAYDIAQDSETAIWVARKMGAAAWARTAAQRFTPHQHGVLVGCPHNGPARYQIDEYNRGENGLTGPARDDGTRVVPLPTWREGIAWAQTLQKPKPGPIQKARQILLAAAARAEERGKDYRAKRLKQLARKLS